MLAYLTLFLLQQSVSTIVYRYPDPRFLDSSYPFSGLGLFHPNTGGFQYSSKAEKKFTGDFDAQKKVVGEFGDGAELIGSDNDEDVSQFYRKGYDIRGSSNSQEEMETNKTEEFYDESDEIEDSNRDVEKGIIKSTG